MSRVELAIERWAEAYNAEWEKKRLREKIKLNDAALRLAKFGGPTSLRFLRDRIKLLNEGSADV